MAEEPEDLAPQEGGEADLYDLGVLGRGKPRYVAVGRYPGGFDFRQSRDQNGLSRKIGSRCPLLISTNVTGEAAVTVALRGAPVSNDISPNTSPDCSRAIVRTPPSASV